MNLARSLALLTLALALVQCGPDDVESDAQAPVDDLPAVHCEPPQEYFYPGCGVEGIDLMPDAGCYYKCLVDPCPEGLECVDVLIDPCWELGCLACGGGERICMEPSTG